MIVGPLAMAMGFLYVAFALISHERERTRILAPLRENEIRPREPFETQIPYKDPTK